MKKPVRACLHTNHTKLYISLFVPWEQVNGTAQDSPDPAAEPYLKNASDWWKTVTILQSEFALLLTNFKCSCKISENLNRKAAKFQHKIAGFIIYHKDE